MASCAAADAFAGVLLTSRVSHPWVELLSILTMMQTGICLLIGEPWRNIVPTHAVFTEDQLNIANKFLICMWPRVDSLSLRPLRQPF